MFRNFLFVALRNLKRQKVYSLINIVGMAAGMAGFALFAHMAGVKLNADKFHAKADRIYGVVQVIQSDNGEEEHTLFTPAPLTRALLLEFPGIEEAVSLSPRGRVLVKTGDESFHERWFLFVSPNFLNTFSFKMAAGDPQTALSQPDSIVISEAAALKFFGDDDPLGKVLTLEKKIDVTITGVVRNLPRTSSLRFEFLVHKDTAAALFGGEDDWRQRSYASFLLLPPGMDKARLEADFPAFLNKYYSDMSDRPVRMYLFPFLDFRLKSLNITSFLASSHPTATIIPFFIGSLLLIVVCINFINLSTVRNLHRTKEVGVRKVVGARRLNLIGLFLGEAVLLALISIPIAVVFYEFLHPILTSYMGVVQSLGYTSKISNSILNYPYLLKYFIGASLLTGLVSGIYPSLVLSSFSPLRMMKGSIQTGRKKRRGAKIMIVFQFCLAVIFIAAAFIIRQQSEIFKKADMGYSRENLAYIQVPAALQPGLDAFKAEISGYPEIERVSASVSLPLVWTNDQPAHEPNVSKEEALTVDAYGVDYDFLETMEMELVQGRTFSRDFGGQNVWIINQTLADKMEWTDPLGKVLNVGDKTGTVVGVVKDFVFDDIGFNIPPAVLYLETGQRNIILIKYSPAVGSSRVLGLLKSKWQEFAPDLPFEGRTMDEYFSSIFLMVDRLAGFLNGIGIGAVIFSCLGLLGLASYLVERRGKEIGIRKIIGATTFRITWMVLREFLLVVVSAAIIGILLVSIGWNRVLHTGLLYIQPIAVWIYPAVISISLAAAVLAVITQTLKAAGSNPVDTLRYE